MDLSFALFALSAFIAVVFALEGAFSWWNTTRGPEAQRLARRLRAMSAGAGSATHGAMLRQRNASALTPLERRLLALPHARHLERLLLQAGANDSFSHLLLKMLMAAGAAGLLARLLHLPLPLQLAALLAGGAVFPLRLYLARQSRLLAFEHQLPAALDLMVRALRAGHAFSATLGMVAEELPEPVAGEFRTAFDEVNFGLPLQDALHNLAARVPSVDLRYFVIAVLLQGNTGGNLTEMLDKLSGLMRARFKLQGTIRVLSAEGRLSAWVLGVLPFAAAGLLYLVNPKFMSTLWTDPAGLRLIGYAVAAALFGIFWMSRLVRIRV